MKPIVFETTCHTMSADLYTPVGIYLRLRDRFAGSVLLESTDFHAAGNSFSYIGVKPIAGIEVTNTQEFEFKYPNEQVIRKSLKSKNDVTSELLAFVKRFQPINKSAISVAQGLLGYTGYDAVRFFEKVQFKQEKEGGETSIPLMRYRMYQYLIAIDHFKDVMYVCENKLPGLESEIDLLLSLIRSKDVPGFPFDTKGQETSNITNEEYIRMVEKGKADCRRGNVFQVVLSRRFQQSFIGDEFNVYRTLRSINPGPYLFYFDYNDYKLFGSSPESQIIIKDGKATIHPIAGTFRRTGNDEMDKVLAEKLLNDPKENAEHVMLVDLARNDLSRHAVDVNVTEYKKVQFYSHVIHLVSEVAGFVQQTANPFEVLAASFPAGTLSGAPKVKAMQLIDEYETTARSYYGGAIGFMGLDGTCNHAIMIRTFLSRNNTLYYQAGAGITAASNAESELQEVNHKLNALRAAIKNSADIK